MLGHRGQVFAARAARATITIGNTDGTAMQVRAISPAKSSDLFQLTSASRSISITERIAREGPRRVGHRLASSARLGFSSTVKTLEAVPQ